MPCLSFVSFEQTLRTLSGIFFPTHVVAGSFRRAPLKRLARFLDAAPHGLASAVAPSRTHLHPHPASERGSSHHAPPQSGRRLAPSASHMLCCRRWTRLLGAVLGQPGPCGPESVPETKAPASPGAGSSPCRLPAPQTQALLPLRAAQRAAGLDRRVRLAWRLPHVGLADRTWRLGCHGYAPCSHRGCLSRLALGGPGTQGLTHPCWPHSRAPGVSSRGSTCRPLRARWTPSAGPAGQARKTDTTLS